MEKSIYKTIFLKQKSNNDKRFIKKISLRKNKNININNEFLNIKIQNKFEKKDYNEKLDQNDFKNNINRNNKISSHQNMNNSNFSNKKIIFYNTLINQRLKNEQN
jgi:hypothetical protein